MVSANILAGGNELAVRWSEDLDEDPAVVQHARGFEVKAFRDGVYLTINETSVSGNVATLTLASTVAETTRLTVRYCCSGTPVKDTAGNRAVWQIIAVSVVASSNSPAEFPANENGSRNVHENTAPGANIGARITAADADNDVLTYSISGPEAAFFEFVETSGQLRTKEPLDHESRATYSFDISVHDSKDVHGNADTTIDDTISVTVTVNDVNEPPEVTGDTDITIDENTVDFSGFYAASDPVGTSSTFTWSLSGTDRGDFEIDSNTGELTLKNVPDHESPADSGGNNEYELTVVATDQGNLRGMLAVTVTVTNVNEPPVVTALGGSDDTRFPENSRSTVGRFQAADPERDTFEWSVSSGDNRFFSIDNGGYLDFNDPPNFEDKPDADGNSVYELTVVADDDGEPIATGTLDVTVTVTDVNEPPSGTGDIAPVVNENTETFLRFYSAADPEGAASAFTWSLSGTDGNDFTIDRNTGALTFRSVPDYESPADFDGNNEYLFQVWTTGQGRLRGSLDVTVTVNEAPEFNSGSKTEFSYRENGTAALHTYRATDPERATIAWSLAGDDQDDFEISGTGVLTFASIPDFEAPADANRDNDYSVTVVASDGSNAATLDVTLTNYTGPEEPAITTTSNPSPYQENGTRAVYTFRARDPQGRPVTWSLQGDDANDFSITSDGGVLSFRTPPDFENPTDANRDNVYEVTAVATDDQGPFDRADVTVTVTNHNEGVEPTITTRSPPSTNRENGTSTVYTFRASDPQHRTITWRLEGNDSGNFSISSTGALNFVGPPNFENPSDNGRDNEHELTVIATDEDFHADRLSFTITVTDVNEGPEVISGQSALTISENQNLPGAVYSGFDPEGETVTKWTVGGRDGGDFQISSDGVLTFRNLPNYESPADSDRDNFYELEVRPYDGRYCGSFPVTVTVNDVNEPPSITTTSSSATVMTHPENRTSRLYTYRATDPEDATIVWSLSGADARFRTIDQQAQFYFSATNPPDFEARPA